MKCNTLINIIGKYNHYSILAAFNLRPEKIVFIRLKEDQDSFENAKACIKGRLPRTTIVEHVISQQCPIEISQILAKYNEEDVFLNLSGGTKLMSILTFQAARGNKATLIYVDNDKEQILRLNERVEVLCPIKVELTVEDIVCSTGAEIIKHSTEIYEKPEFRQLVEFLVANYDMWKLVKDVLRHGHLVKQCELQPLLIEIIASRLSYMEVKAMEKFLKELAARQLVSEYKFFFDHIEFTFSHREAKAFVMTIGCWLEALTYHFIKETEEVSNAISGMLFVWDEELEVHNELDVVAAVDSHLVSISCKDTANYDVDELNELEVYAEHLGGRKVTKILVSTHLPERGEMICQRAEEMGIHIVVFNGNMRSFQKELRDIIIRK